MKKTWQTKLCTNITSFLQEISNKMTWCILIGCPYGPFIYSPEKLTVGYINKKVANAFKNIFLTKEKKYMPFTYIFETDNFFFWQDTNLLLIQDTYHHQMAVVPWESRYNSETTLTLISVCLLFTLLATHFCWNEWECIQQSRHFLIGSKCIFASCPQPPSDLQGYYN